MEHWLKKLGANKSKNAEPMNMKEPIVFSLVQPCSFFYLWPWSFSQDQPIVLYHSGRFVPQLMDHVCANRRSTRHLLSISLRIQFCGVAPAVVTPKA
eukprot:800847-Prorocentrum_minimum.AAC.4